MGSNSFFSFSSLAARGRVGVKIRLFGLGAQLFIPAGHCLQFFQHVATSHLFSCIVPEKGEKVKQKPPYLPEIPLPEMKKTIDKTRTV